MLKSKGVEMKKNPEMYKAWKKQWDRVESEVKSLSSSDMTFVSDEYSKWFKSTFKEDLKQFKNLSAV